MKTENLKLCLCIVILLIFFTVLGLSDDQKAVQNSSESPVIVSAAWLDQHIKDNGLVILHVSSTRAQYEMGHIPGARFLWRDWLIESTPESTFVPPATERITEILENLGISNTSKIVLCASGGNIAPVSRIFATLEYIGMSGRVSILDGGYEDWVAEGGAVSRKTPVIEKVKFIPILKPDVFVPAEFVLKNIGKEHFTVIDARYPRNYSGESGYPRKGHIPGAVNIPAGKVIDDKDKFLEMDKLRELFVNAGIKPNSDLTVHCFVGQSASMVYVAARQLGYEVHIYDGSFEEWSARDDLPLEVSPKPAEQK
jgi:thiosulfate/3-mercaptopyruvate sulfurtransferase